MQRLFVLLGAVAALAVIAVGAANADTGNSINATACQLGGWQNLARSQDNTSGFANQGDCVSYAAHGGRLVPKVIPVSEPMFGLDSTTCSVTVPYTPGINTYLYGVNGYPQDTPITQDVKVTGALDGSFGTAPQFWIGYTAQPGYVISNPGAAPWHFDFYNGDNVRDC